MSTYTDYDDVCKTYDQGRIADGVDVMTMILCGLLKKDASEVHILEAGCGTGNFSIKFLEQGIGQLTMVDGSQGMLNKATEKVKEHLDRVHEIKQVLLPNIPYPDASFDVVSFVQVLHHLDSYHTENGEKLTYPVLGKALCEAHRVLKPGGVLLIDHAFEENIMRQPLSLAPKAMALLRQVFLPDEILLQKVKQAAFVNTFYVVRPESTIFSEEARENFERVLNPKWRAIDSAWEFVKRTGELEPLLEMLGQKKKDGTLDDFIQDFYSSKKSVGDHNVIFARKL